MNNGWVIDSAAFMGIDAEVKLGFVSSCFSLCNDNTGRKIWEQICHALFILLTFQYEYF